MVDVEIYVTRTCPYCMRAKQLMARKGIVPKEIDVSDDAILREGMMQRAGGRRTVPQIFIAGQHVGGCDDLYALDREGKLDLILGGQPA